MPTSINSGIIGHLPALHALLPLLAAPVAALLPNVGARLMQLLVMFALVVLSLYGLSHFWSGGDRIVYFFGGWPAPMGIELRLNAAIAALLCVMSLTGVASTLNEFSESTNECATPQYHCLFLLCYAGLAGMALTYDMFNMYVFLEIGSLATYALIGLGRDRRALTSGFEYLILGSVGAGFILLGIGVVYFTTGTLNMEHAASLLPRGAGTVLTGTALAFFAIGFAMKLAVAPMHIWLVNAYENAPGNASAFLSSAATKAALFGLIKIIYVVFGGELTMRTYRLSEFLFVAGAFNVVLGAYMAAMQHRLKRILAYSSVSHIGYMLLALSFSDAQGAAVVMTFVIHHGVVKSSLFLVADYFERRFGGRLSDIKNAAASAPAAVATFALLALSLAGLPGTSGFSAKWAALSHAAERGEWGVVVTIVVGSLLAFVYLGRILEACWCERSRLPGRAYAGAAVSSVPLWIGGAGLALSVFLGCRYDVFLRIGTMAAESWQLVLYQNS
ncbi:MAG: proton-conducting transporter membrane subunit [Rickettsiales bacterium]